MHSQHPFQGVYSTHLRRQKADLQIFMEDEELVLDPQLDYDRVEGVSAEVRERLCRVRPTNIVSTYSDTCCSDSG